MPQQARFTGKLPRLPEQKHPLTANSVDRNGQNIDAGKLVRSYTVVLARLDGVQAHEAEDGQRPTGGREDAERAFRARTVTA